ncbi:MAG TPA: Fur family transcriptional regulator [Dehalococcoidia bacterium]|jgi:Fur family zinc uptake transcriptional regulator
MSELQCGIQVLRANGYKVTQPRKQVLAVLDAAHEPVSPYEIQKIIEENGKHLNHVTIYRILDLFCDLNLAHKVLLLNGFVKCSLGKKEGCHRFMVCRECGSLKEFADKALCQEENEIAQDLGFKSEHHFSEFSGICSNCRS